MMIQAGKWWSVNGFEYGTGFVIVTKSPITNDGGGSPLADQSR